MNALQRAFGADAAFLIVYLSEAHAADVWPLGSVESVRAHRSVAARVARAKRVTDTYGAELPVLVDNMSNGFDAEFAAWPERCVQLTRLVFALF